MIKLDYDLLKKQIENDPDVDLPFGVGGSAFKTMKPVPPIEEMALDLEIHDLIIEARKRSKLMIEIGEIKHASCLSRCAAILENYRAKELD